MEKREFTNKFSDMHDFTINADLKQKIEDCIQEYTEYTDDPDSFAKYLNIKNNFDDSSQDYSVYTGMSGIAYMHLRLGNLVKAKQIIKPWLYKLKGRRVSFLCGDPGPLALACIIYYKQRDLQKYQKYVDKLLHLKQQVLKQDSELPDELLYGRAGYLAALLLVRNECDCSSIEKPVLRQIIEKILESGVEYSKQHRCKSPLMYEWHGKRYYGAAHGLAGIYSILLQSNLLQDHEIQNLLKPSVDHLLSKAFQSGNFPSSEGNEKDRLVHWCHGAPGIVHLLLQSYTLWGENKYLQASLKCGELIWIRGLLKKGEGLCHGSAGNGYAFLHLYQVTKEKLWLNQAAMFAVHCTQINQHIVNLPDRPLSLFEGLAGTVCFLKDVLDPKHAKFPAFIL